MLPNRKDPLFWPTRAKEYYIYVLSKEQSEAKHKAAMFKNVFSIKINASQASSIYYLFDKHRNARRQGRK